MFPVPSHLPKTGGEHVASPWTEVAGDTEPSADTVLELFEPLLRDGKLDSKTVKGVREKVQDAIRTNKVTSHGIVKANYPSISSHIRNGSQITADFKSIQQSLNELESKLDPGTSETSFIPPLISLLRRHFTAVQAQLQASSRATALKELKRRTERLKKLEERVYGARGADEDVLNELEGGNGSAGGALEQAEIMRTIRARTDLLRGLVEEQVVGGYKQAVAISEESDGQSDLVIKKEIQLQRPRNPSAGYVSAKTEPSPTYSLEDIYTALARLRALEEPVRQLQSRILKSIVTPILSGTHSIEQGSSDTSTTLHLRPSSRRSSSDILVDLSTLFAHVHSSVFPDIAIASQARANVLTGLHASTSELLLSTLISPSTPNSLDGLPAWLDTIRSAVDVESTTKPGNAGTPVSSFLDHQAGLSWANLRRSRVGGQVRRLIINGWAGWEAVEISRNKEISIVVEVEVDEEEVKEDLAMEMEIDTKDKPDEANNSWGFDVPEPSTTNTGKTKSEETVQTEEEGGWDFEEPTIPTQSEAGPSSPRRPPADDVEDGWAFDDDLSTPGPPPLPKPAPKPMREAKKLGKKVAKSKLPQEDQESGMESEEMSRTNSIASATPPRAATPPLASAEAMDWEAWDDEAKKDIKPKTKRKVLKDEKRVIKETFLVSKACDTLLELAESVLRDARVIADSPPAPSFAPATGVLYTTTTEIFDLYRSLIRSHFAAQLQSVPTLSMQVYNDSIHLSDRVETMSRDFESWKSSDVGRRLREFGEGCFERELERQRDSLISTLEGIEWNRGVEGFKRSAKIPSQVRNDLEDLSRMFQPVLPTTTYLSVMGYLVNVAITYVTDAILSQQDITEEESNHLNELLRTLHPLEELFVLEPGQPSSVVEHVHGWLKFCYLSELLSANLVDITYLFENGALVDFTADELISLLKALFADSEKREKAIERIERGL